MLKSFQTAILYALENIQSNFFHTLLSVIGITIGVSALIIILSMIDGLEKYAEDQISNTTSVKVVEVSSVTMKSVDGVPIPKDNPVILTEQIHEDIISGITVPFTAYRVAEMAMQVSIENQDIGALVYYADRGYAGYYSQAHGAPLFNDRNKNKENPGAVISTVLAKRIAGDSYDSHNIIGKNLSVENISYNIVGIVEGLSPNPEILLSIHNQPIENLQNHPPYMAIEAGSVEDVPAVKKSVQEWRESSSFTEEDIQILSQDYRVDQATQGFMLFRIIMGLIVGISVIVGGIGVMNVLLISVTQRTKEIGIRKAVGSRKKDIYVQFLSESMVISLFGTLVGVLIGILVSIAMTPIVHQIIDVPFRPAFSLLTITVITLFSLLIGILFGTFPAYKASQLSPIDALRRE
jgi:putative ABC transport system permease protein